MTNNDLNNIKKIEYNNNKNSKEMNNILSDSDSKKLNSLEKLYNFMQKYRNETKTKTGSNIAWTHSMTDQPFGSYNIPEDMYPKFLKLYENAVVDGFQLHITEKHKEYGPIVMDFDFLQDKENDKRYYTETTIINIIKIYNTIIKKYLNVDSKDMDTYVTEKDKPTLRGGKYHDGIHIIYPYICTKPSLQLIMRNKFIEEAEEKKIFNHIPLLNSLEQVFDKSVIYHTGWMLYGSKKNKNSSIYKVTHIYNTANGKIYDTLIPHENINTRPYIKHFINALSCRRFFDESQMTTIINPMIIDTEINKIRDNKVTTNNHKNEDINILVGKDINFIKTVSNDLLIEAKNLVKLFSIKRAEDYFSWYQVGKCLYNIDYRLLDDWIEFSKKCPKKFREGECEKLWKKMKNSNYTMATLHYFASQDNFEKYQQMKEEKINKLIQDGLEASHNTIAKLLMEKYKFAYKCASIKHDVWYEFKNHRWIEIDSAYTLRNLISDELIQEYAKRQLNLYDTYKQQEGYLRDKCLEEASRISKVIKQLNNSTFKNGVIKECAYISYDPNFLKNLDENNYLLCFENGVYDLESDNFRPGCPDDYISLSTGYNYIELDENDSIAKEIQDFLEKIQTEKIMREYLMTLLSTCLAGSISEESFYVFIGSGANGKSKIMELLKYTLGDYFKPMDIRLLTEKRSSSSSASPEVADKKGIRACPFDEPKATDEINTGFMKIFTGGDVITARALFREPIYFKPQFKPFLLCNHLPNIKADDDGTWRRLKVVPFSSKFIKSSEATKKMRKEGLKDNQFWADNKLSEKLPEWKQTFMGMLIKYYKKYKKEGLIHPKIVTKETANYRRRCDVFQDFIGDYLEKTNNPKDIISTINLHDAMRSWYRANYDGKCPNTKELRNYLQNRVNTFNGKNDCLTQYRIKQTDNIELDTDLGEIISTTN